MRVLGFAHRSILGRLGKKMETTIAFRVLSSGFRIQGFRAQDLAALGTRECGVCARGVLKQTLTRLLHEKAASRAFEGLIVTNL